MRNWSNGRLRLAALAICIGASAWGATIQNFVIVNSTSPTNPGGIFPDGGTYAGSVSFDTSQIGSSTGNLEFPLAAFHIVLTGSINVDFNSASGASGVFVGVPAAVPFLGNGEIDQLQFSQQVNSQFFEFVLSFIEPPGAFHGGLIFTAEEQIAGGVNLFDRSGSALLVDPAALAPEPPSSTLLYGALFLVTLRAVILCAKNQTLKSQTTKGRSSS